MKTQEVLSHGDSCDVLCIQCIPKIGQARRMGVVVNFIAVKTFVLPQRSISVLNLKDFQEECRVDHLVPNQIQILYKALLKSAVLKWLILEPVASRSLKAIELCGFQRL
jgi:hypothetical protein